jgi:excisionase family DNA binding protein
MALRAAKNETVWITADEAAHRLGVSKPTLYAYVSRGKIGRTLADDGRRSRFNAAEVAVLGRGKPKPPSPGMTELRLASAVTRIDDTTLFYRGVPIGSLVGQKNFEHVASLLWQHGPSTWTVDQALVRQIIAFRTVSIQVAQDGGPSASKTRTLNANAGSLDHQPGQAASQMAQLVLQLGYLRGQRDLEQSKNETDMPLGDLMAKQTAELLGATYRNALRGKVNLN